MSSLEQIRHELRNHKPDCDGPTCVLLRAVDTLEVQLADAQAVLDRIIAWSEAYPLDIFPEPDFKAVRAALQAHGLTLAVVSASNMRHVVEGVGKIAREAKP